LVKTLKKLKQERDATVWEWRVLRERLKDEAEMGIQQVLSSRELEEMLMWLVMV